MDDPGFAWCPKVSERLQQYLGDGFVLVRRAIPLDVVQQWLRQLSTLEVMPNGLVPVHAMTDHDATSRLASELLGTEAELFGATFVVRQPRSPWRVSWHQDGEPWRRQWGIDHAVTIWVALDATGPHNGCLRMIPGSHHGPLMPLEQVNEPFDVFGWASPTSVVDESNAVDVVLDAGDISAHHPATVHASGPNGSSGPRRALSLRYRPTGVR